VDGHGGTEVRVSCWVVRDTGLLAAPGRFRRLHGEVRHHRGEGAAWPDPVILEVADGWLRVGGVGEWPLDDVEARLVQVGPPVTFVLRVPGAAQLLATAGGLGAQALLSRLVV
jgi:hypothetical protein